MIANESIMDATLKMIATHGIKGATTRQLAEAAHINEATIFKKFKNKENLIHQTLELQIETMKAEIDTFFEQDFANYDVFLQEASHYILTLYQRYRDFMIISVKEMGSRDMAFIDPSAVEYLYQKVDEKIEGLLDEQTAKEDAEAVSLILNSVILLVMVEKVKSDVHDRPPLIDINAETLTEVLRRIVKKA